MHISFAFITSNTCVETASYLRVPYPHFNRLLTQYLGSVYWMNKQRYQICRGLRTCKDVNTGPSTFSGEEFNCTNTNFAKQTVQLSPNSEGKCSPLYVKCVVTLAARHVLWTGFPAMVGDRWTCSGTESCLTSLFFFFLNFNHLWAGCVCERYCLPLKTEGSLPTWGSTPITVFFRQWLRENTKTW